MKTQPIKVRDTHVEIKAGWVKPATYRHRCGQVKRAVADAFDVPVADLDLRDRSEPLVFARMAAMAIVYEDLGGSTKRVAHAFQKVCHGTTLNAQRQHAALMECDQRYRAKVLAAKRRLDESGVLTPDGTEEPDGLAIPSTRNLDN